MTNLTELITLWIGEEKQPTLEGTVYNPINSEPACVAGYNQALKDLKSKIPDLIEQIVTLVKQTPRGTKYNYYTALELRDEILKTLNK